MKEDNKKFISPETFHQRVINVLEQKNISLDELYNRITKEIGYTISKNNLSIYFQRVPSVNFLIALSKALNVSTDYLLGLKDFDCYSEGFDYQIEKQRYKKYLGEYVFYFYPTVSNSPQTLIGANLKIYENSSYRVELIVTTDEDEKKEYFGDLTLSKDYSVGFISLQGRRIGEKVYMSFCDPTINGNTEITTLLGSMMSISSGDFKRLPVMSRFFLYRGKDLSSKALDVIKSNLFLNSKYISIESRNIIDSLNDIELDAITKNKIIERLTSAFEEKKYYRIEESYILNTLKNDFNLPFIKIEEIIASLRLSSNKNANIKLNKSIDSRIFNYLKNTL